MNMSGAIGSSACSLAFPYVVQLAGRAEPFFWLAAALNATAAFSWLVLARRS
jgi:MFS transporter, ACS family, glucarate transporter